MDEKVDSNEEISTEIPLLESQRSTDGQIMILKSIPRVNNIKLPPAVSA
jgi:hypothetical protein